MLKKLSGNTVIGLLFIIISGITLYIANTTLPATAPAGDPGSRIFPSAMHYHHDPGNHPDRSVCQETGKGICRNLCK